MNSERNERIESQEDSYIIPFIVWFPNFLNLVALGLIIYIIYFFSNTNLNEHQKVKTVKQKVKIEFVNNGKYSVDKESLNEMLDEKFSEFEEDIQKSEKERNENMKYYGTIIGFILSIVGFFGFKSIHDTRQMALDAVKAKAEEVAKKATNEKISDLTKGHVEVFLNNDGKRDIERIAETIASKKGSEVARNEMDMIKIDIKDYRKAIQEDIETTQRFQNNNFNFLLKRIQELELKLYGKPDDDDMQDFDNNPKINPDNEQQPVL
ncbi:MAG: hypothetical protein JST78_08965 [Bacteroidetes bacterium]|nr:hypothetical protein [Bacteroidota bacterium]